MKKLINTLMIITLLMSGTNSCTDLEEKVYDTIVSDNFYKTEEEIITTMAPIYADLRNILAYRNIIDLEEITTDIIVHPTREYGGCFGGGMHQRYHEHTWNAETGGITSIWTTAFQFINRANMLLYQYEQLEEFDPELKDIFMGELRAIRAFGYYCLLNAYGNVPIVDRFDVEEGFKPTNSSNFDEGRTKVFEFIEDELLSCIPGLKEEVDLSTYGRFNKWAAMTILVKLYMNAEVWTGVPRWDDAITYADQIISSGKYQLETNYFTNFARNNEGSKENIFVLVFHPTLTGGNVRTQAFAGHHHSMVGPAYGVPAGGNNCRSAIPSHIHSYHPDDIRLKGWAIGPQINKTTGEPILSNRPPYHPVVYTIDFSNIYDPDDPVVRDYTNAMDYDGARFLKYEVSYEPGTNMENDWAVYRLADVILLKAEALMRKNGGMATQEAVNLVNQVHNRAFENPEQHLYDTNTLTLDELLAERGRELYYEGMRRNDLIRFGKFARGTWEWYDRSNNGDHTNWFPIPQEQINANNNLIQNPGY
jgi:hypothetical protein